MQPGIYRSIWVAVSPGSHIAYIKLVETVVSNRGAGRIVTQNLIPSGQTTRLLGKLNLLASPLARLAGWTTDLFSKLAEQTNKITNDRAGQPASYVGLISRWTNFTRIWAG